MIISLDFNDEYELLIKKYATINKLSEQDFIYQIVVEEITTMHDLEKFDESMTEYKNNPITYSTDEVEKELDINI